MTKKNLTFEVKEDALFQSLGVVYAEVCLDDNILAKIYTRGQLAQLMGGVVLFEGVDLEVEAYPFFKKFGERLAPNLETIIKKVKEAEREDVGREYRFEVCRNQGCDLNHKHGIIANPLTSTAVYSFTQALEAVREAVKRKLPVKIGIGLLQDVIKHDLPLGVPASWERSEAITVEITTKTTTQKMDKTRH